MAGNQPSQSGNLQLGLSNLLLSLGSLPQLQSTVTLAAPKAACKYTYQVRFVNLKRKSEFTLRDWHDMVERFTTIEQLKFKLLESFPKEFPSASSTTFQIGYLEPPNQAKKWLCDVRDLQKMYASFPSGSWLTLWCEVPVHKDDKEEPPSKKAGLKPQETSWMTICRT